jgi:hypothetical protein
LLPDFEPGPPKRHFPPITATCSTIGSGGVILCKFNRCHRMGTAPGVFRRWRARLAGTTTNRHDKSWVLFTMFFRPFFATRREIHDSLGGRSSASGGPHPVPGRHLRHKRGRNPFAGWEAEVRGKIRVVIRIRREESLRGAKGDNGWCWVLGFSPPPQGLTHPGYVLLAPPGARFGTARVGRFIRSQGI